MDTRSNWTYVHINVCKTHTMWISSGNISPWGYHVDAGNVRVKVKAAAIKQRQPVDKQNWLRMRARERWVDPVRLILAGTRTRVASEEKRNHNCHRHSFMWNLTSCCHWPKSYTALKSEITHILWGIAGESEIMQQMKLNVKSAKNSQLMTNNCKTLCCRHYLRALATYMHTYITFVCVCAWVSV